MIWRQTAFSLSLNDNTVKAPPLITGYQVTNSLVLRIRELDRVGEIMQAAIDAGGNNFESLTYAVDDDDNMWRKPVYLQLKMHFIKP